MKTIHSHVVGSMLRPQELLDARERRHSGELTPHEFRAIEDRAVDRAIEVQEAAGIEVITDGEQRRADFMESLLASVSGVTEIEMVGASVADDSFWHRDDPEYQPKTWVPPAVVEKIARDLVDGWRGVRLRSGQSHPPGQGDAAESDGDAELLVPRALDRGVRQSR